MKYQKEIDQIFSNAFREDWMIDEDWHEIELELYNKIGETKQSISDKIQIGVDKGYSIEQQINIIGKIFK